MFGSGGRAAAASRAGFVVRVARCPVMHMMRAAGAQMVRTARRIHAESAFGKRARRVVAASDHAGITGDPCGKEGGSRIPADSAAHDHACFAESKELHDSFVSGKPSGADTSRDIL